MTLDKMYAVWDGVIYELESVMPKTDSAALKKHENGKDIMFNVPKADISKAWFIHKVPIYGKIRCGNITVSGSRCFIIASVTLLHGDGSGTASRLTDLGFEQFVYDDVTDTACFIKQTDISDTLLEFEETKKDINIMYYR